MDYYVYIIYSDQAGVYYKGFTSYPVLRLEELVKAKKKEAAPTWRQPRLYFKL
jgi:predicted GIY-YIG superfamily endonuclease